MGYSESPETLLKMMPFLEPLLTSEEVVWRTSHGAARLFAYKIREALSIARKLPNCKLQLGYETRNVPAYRDFKITVAGPALVKASLRVALRVERVDDLMQPREAVAYVETREIKMADFLLSIKESWRRRGHQDRVHLPNAHPSREDLISLHSWCQEAGLMFFEADGALTIMMKEGNEEAAEFSWSPDDD